jgi:class 3 adenylate cyclase/tetratricopeptide (TPR) repeat protein
MQCPQCGFENRVGAKFCRECGCRFEVACPACGAKVEAGSKFCDECGASTATAPASAAPAKQATSRYTSPETYTPQHLAERIISSRGALEGERKQVTVLFADLKGSMELLADRDPEEARRLLDPVLERMMEAVHRYEGTVNQVLGDGIMALFGAPLAHEDHAVRACYAALRMQEAVREYAEEVRRTEGVLIQIRVGLNSGEVVVRSIGSDLRMDYTAVGQTTHLAARMEQLAAAGSILLAPDTLQLAEGYFQVKALGPMSVKGLGEPVEVYELLGAGTARSRLQAAVGRGFTKFVGRDTELETLRHTLDRAGSGHGQVVALVGEPGVGKSRLVWEFTHSHRAHGWLVLASGSVSYGKATSYLPVIDLLKSYCGIEPRDDPRRMRQKLLGKVLDLDRTLEPLLPPLLGLLDVSGDDAAWQALDPSQRRQRTLDALKRLLLRESQEQPLLLIFEDLHWIDAATQALLDNLVDSLPTAHLLLLVNYRPEYEHAWHRKTYYQQLRLDPLPPASAEELLDALLGDDSSFYPLRHPLIERTEGNPFFLEESVRTLVETGALVGERGAYRAVQPLAATQVPATVQAVLAARIDRLAPEDKRLLQSTAVVGKDVPYALLQAVADLPEHELREGLGRLQTAEFLYETTLFPELEYTFKHALTHEVVYGSLLGERRRALHAGIVAAMQTLYPDRLAEHVEQFAHHALRGEVWEQAVAFGQQAGEKAAARSAYREAREQFELALGALGHLPATRAHREQAIDLQLSLRVALTGSGQREQSVQPVHEAEVLARELGDARRLALALSTLANHYWGGAEYRRAMDYAQGALETAETLDDPGFRAAGSVMLGRVYHALGQYARAEEHLRAGMAATEDAPLREYPGQPFLSSVGARVWLAHCATERGDFRTAHMLGEAGLHIAQTIGHPWSLINGYWGAGYACLRQGQAEQAIAALEPAVQTCETWHIPLLSPYSATLLGQAYILAGRTADAQALLERATEQVVMIGNLVYRVAGLLALSEIHLVADRQDPAHALASEALALSQAQGARGEEARAGWLLGEIAAHGAPPAGDQAEADYRQSLSLAEELGMRPLVAHCHLGLGTLYQKVGRSDQAQPELATAAQMYRTMELTFWLEKAEAALAQGAR